jgi:hypothetical protein
LSLSARLENKTHGEKISVEAKDFSDLTITGDDEAGTIGNRENLIIVGTENIECPSMHFLVYPYHRETARLYEILDDSIEG